MANRQQVQRYAESLRCSPTVFRSKTRGWEEVCSEAPKCEQRVHICPGPRETRLPSRSALRVFPEAAQSGRHPALAAADPVKGETGQRASPHYLEVLRLVRQQRPGLACTSLPFIPKLVRGRVGRQLPWRGGSPRAWGTTRIQERLCLISREPLVLRVLLSSCVWEERVLMRPGSLWPCPSDPAQPMEYPKGMSIKTSSPLSFPHR